MHTRKPTKSQRRVNLRAIADLIREESKGELRVAAPGTTAFTFEPPTQGNDAYGIRRLCVFFWYMPENGLPRPVLLVGRGDDLAPGHALFLALSDDVSPFGPAVKGHHPVLLPEALLEQHFGTKRPIAERIERAPENVYANFKTVDDPLRIGPFLFFQSNTVEEGPHIVFDACRQLGLMGLPEAGTSGIDVRPLSEARPTLAKVPFAHRVALARAYMTALDVSLDDLRDQQSNP
jgi:hypothetical protein